MLQSVMSKEIYIAGRADNNESVIKNLTNELEVRTHLISLKWWEGERPSKPYLDYSENSKKAEDMINAVIKSDIFILITDDSIFGSMAEFGAALTSKKEDLIIVKGNSRQSIFFTHPKVVVLENIEEIKNRAWY